MAPGVGAAPGNRGAQTTVHLADQIGNLGARRQAGRGRAADIPRPSAAVMGRAALSDSRTADRRDVPAPDLRSLHRSPRSGAGRSCPQPPIETGSKPKMSVSDWLRGTTTMDRENVIPPKTDAEFVAEAAAVALTEGRYELGRALADLASRAARIEAAAVPRMVPMIGATREEHPGQTTDMYAAGPTGNGDQDLAAAAQTEIFGQQDQRMAVAKSARCATEIGQGAYREPCHRPLYWRTGNIGDQDHPATIAGWYHVDPALDQDHMPTVDQGAH